MKLAAKSLLLVSLATTFTSAKPFHTFNTSSSSSKKTVPPTTFSAVAP